MQSNQEALNVIKSGETPKVTISSHFFNLPDLIPCKGYIQLNVALPGCNLSKTSWWQRYISNMDLWLLSLHTTSSLLDMSQSTGQEPIRVKLNTLQNHGTADILILLPHHPLKTSTINERANLVRPTTKMCTTSFVAVAVVCIIGHDIQTCPEATCCTPRCIWAQWETTDVQPDENTHTQIHSYHTQTKTEP